MGLCGNLSLVDLAGSERDSETNKARQNLRDGENINRSLLALANYINAILKSLLLSLNLSLLIFPFPSLHSQLSLKGPDIEEAFRNKVRCISQYSGK